MQIAVNSWEEVDRPVAAHGDNSLVGLSDEYQQLFRFLRFRKEPKPPFCIRKSERPDFILSDLVNKTGIEVTWAANQSWEEAEAYLGNEQQPEYQQISRNWFEGVDKRGKELGEFLKTRQSDSPSWGAEEQAKAKAEEVKNCICQKSDDFTERTYQRFRKNWLLISDKSPFFFLDINVFSKIMIEFLRQYSVHHDKIYLLTKLRNREEAINSDVLVSLFQKNSPPKDHLHFQHRTCEIS